MKSHNANNTQVKQFCRHCPHCRSRQGAFGQLSEAEHRYYNAQVKIMRPLILQAMAWRGQELVCAYCGASEPLEMHHLRYAPDITIDDLELLCEDCHALVTFRLV